MQVKLPAVLGVDAKSRLGRVRQIAALPTTIDCSAVKYTLGKSVGHVLHPQASYQHWAAVRSDASSVTLRLRRRIPFRCNYHPNCPTSRAGRGKRSP
jgi:hypothetical protein